MDRERLEEALRRADAALQEGRSLKGTGFWRAVAAARQDAALAERYADRIGQLDRRAFEQGVSLRVPAAAGTTALAAATAAGAAGVLAAGKGRSRLGRSAVFLVGFGALEIGTHSLAHWVVGRVMGMRFTHYFLGGPPPPRPGAKLDYGSYLRVPPRRRAVMHASGAVVTKVIPFALIPAARSSGLYRWVAPLLMLVGVGQLTTDVLLSTKSSDWKKVKRELQAAKTWR
ncbi:MAG TPA: hypothetical protein VHJ78_13125 [Actinomycetota bacterium]|nr:hypothetical protein [Actinomycetota bacterium]